MAPSCTCDDGGIPSIGMQAKALSLWKTKWPKVTGLKPYVGLSDLSPSWAWTT